MLPAECMTFIVNEETGGEAYYSKFASSPVWPGGTSGVTIGVGYDLGQTKLAAFQADWGGVLSAAAMQALTPAIGLQGGNPDKEATIKQICASCKGSVTIPFQTAVDVFEKTSLPKYTTMTTTAFPGLDKLDGLCIGAMVSLVYNRGTSITGPSRTEMAAIRDMIQQGKTAGIPDQFRSMKRLWPTVPGLQKRRDAEADMFQRGLNAMAGQPATA